MSLFYKSNESKERKYVKENKIRELNEEAQQQIVDEQIDKELGLDRKATNIGLLSKRVADKFINAEKSKVQEDVLLNAINNGKLSELFNKLKVLPDSVLTKTQRIIRDDLKNEEIKNMINESISEAIPNGPEAIKSAFLKIVGGADNENIVIDMIDKTRSAGESKIIKTKKDSNKTKVELSKENVLDKVGFTNKIKPVLNSNLDILDKAIKFNKLSNLFKELKSIPEDYLNETQKNIKLKLTNSQSKEIINDLIANAVDMGNVKELNKIVLNELITIGNKKEEKDLNEMLNMAKDNDNDSDGTETTSIAGLSNRGRPADTREQALKKMHEYKEKGDTLSLKLWEKKNNKYVVRKKKREDLQQAVANAYNNADKLAKKHGFN